MEKSFSYYGANISYNIVGSGNVIVLLHGFGEDSSIFNQQVEFLQDKFQLITIDLPGTGNSDVLPKESIGIEDYATCVLHVLQHEKIATCILLGHSMGGYVTLAFAEKYSSLLKGFGLIHSSAAPDNEEKKTARLQAIKMMEEYGPFAFLKNTIPNLFAGDFKRSNSKQIELLIEQSRQFSKQALPQYYTAMMNRPDRAKVLENALVPVLFILGKQDVAAPLEVVINQVHLPNISHIHILENVAHMGMLEATETVNDKLLAFANSVYNN